MTIFNSGTLTRETLRKLTLAQLKYMSTLATDDDWQHSDETNDNLTSAITLADLLHDLTIDTSMKNSESQEFQDTLDMARYIFDNKLHLFTGGICQEIHDLHPRSLDDNFEPPPPTSHKNTRWVHAWIFD
jgi:hypothetical protein